MQNYVFHKLNGNYSRELVEEMEASGEGRENWVQTQPLNSETEFTRRMNLGSSLMNKMKMINTIVMSDM